MVEPLAELLRDRPASIMKAKEKGAKVVGYFCPYVPVELIHAAGMIPLRLVFGGDVEAAEAGEQFLGSYSCPYVRACLGYRALGKDPYYAAVDALCVASTCDGMKRIQDYWQYYFKVPVFSLGVPRTYDRFRLRPYALDYFEKELALLKKRLEKLSGRVVTDRQLRDSIKLYNSIRLLMRELYDSPSSGSPGISWSDVFQISQTGLLLDPSEFLEELKGIHKVSQPSRVLATRGERRAGSEGEDEPRLILYGSLISLGDRKVIDIIEQAGGDIVADAICTGSKFWRKDVSTSDRPISALAERYLTNVSCPYMMDMGMRVSYVTKVVRENQADGLIYYNLRYCEGFRGELRSFEDALKKEMKIPVLLIETEYSPSDVGTIRTKVEAFLEMIRGVHG
jgi:benzoyl-CoA reductase/2-hydroxyglutaryl-CoA dehydratase subunit BcrC/BadD/HgdB